MGGGGVRKSFWQDHCLYLTGTFAYSEDPDEMPQYISSGSVLFA